MKKIISIIALFLLAMASCHRPKGVSEEKSSASVESTEASDYIIWNDSFTVVYRQPVNGYNVKAVVKIGESDFFIMKAAITFEKEGKAFTLNTSCFGDSIFSRGRLDFDEENPKILKKYRGKTIYANYHATEVDWKNMIDNTPFFFKDMDFDGVKELVIVHHSMAVRYHDGYDVYRIVDGEPVLIDYPPYKSGEYDDFGMTDYPKFDYKHKTISCPYPEGEMKYIGQTIFGISKKQKDTVVVNGKKYLFNHLEPIKEIKY